MNYSDLFTMAAAAHASLGLHDYDGTIVAAFRAWCEATGRTVLVNTLKTDSYSWHCLGTSDTNIGIHDTSTRARFVEPQWRPEVAQ